MTTATVEAPLDLRAVYRRLRMPIGLLVLLLVVGVVLAWIESQPLARPLDPRDASPAGGRALAQLLGDRGVDVVPMAPSAAAPTAASATTVFIPDPRSLTSPELQAIGQSAADVVTVAPTDRELTALGIPVQLAGGLHDTLAPDCDIAAATVAGTVRFDGAAYAFESPATGCYVASDAAGMTVTQHGAARRVVFGSPETFANERLADEGDAALGLGLLDENPRLIWVIPQPPTEATAGRAHKSLVQLLPHRLLWALLELLVAVLLVALWRARRLGPVVAEPLPVVVRATETVEGRGRLLRGARARGHAAQSLRTATAARLRDLLALGRDAPPEALTEAVARRLGEPGAEVATLLYGGVPTDDKALVKLAADLDALEQRVRQS